MLAGTALRSYGITASSKSVATVLTSDILTTCLDSDLSARLAMISVTCQSCAKTFRAPINLAGKRVKCPKCSQPLDVPQAAAVVSDLPAANPPSPPAPLAFTAVQTSGTQPVAPTFQAGKSIAALNDLGLGSDDSPIASANLVTDAVADKAPDGFAPANGFVIQTDQPTLNPKEKDKYRSRGVSKKKTAEASDSATSRRKPGKKKGYPLGSLMVVAGLSVACIGLGAFAFRPPRAAEPMALNDSQASQQKQRPASAVRRSAGRSLQSDLPAAEPQALPAEASLESLSAENTSVEMPEEDLADVGKTADAPSATPVPTLSEPRSDSPQPPGDGVMLSLSSGKIGKSDPSLGLGDAVKINFGEAEPSAATPAASDSTSSSPPGGLAESLAAATADKAADLTEVLVAHKDQSLFKIKYYPNLRKLFATRFATSYDAEIRDAYAGDYDAIQAWFEKYPDIREEFYTAIKPEFDDVKAALSLFAELYRKFPDRLHSYADLAIAISVTWDKPKGGVYDYAHHQSRTKSTMPDGLAEAVDNFEYIVKAESFMQGRGQYLPWEFMTLLVDHRTPVAEREWALANYVSRRAGFGQCYKEVPYDHEMLDTKSEVCKLAGKPYSLPMIKQFGGVCAMQADFAARVGKSIGVPAAYVRGKSAYGDNHAWVMWVELQNITPSSISFTLESFGRYFGDKYYVGTLSDPQTGQEITDRDLELRLYQVGVSAIAKRHAALLMEVYPEIAEVSTFKIADRLAYLGAVLTVGPGNEAAWSEVAHLSGSEEVGKTHKKQMARTLDNLFRTFANYPDFTWKVFDDLIAYEKGLPAKTLLYERLVVLYESAGRPDLACEARMKLAEYQVEMGKMVDAVNGLAFTVRKFPDEGRYVPQLIDKMELICASAPDAAQLMLPFYTSILPLIPKTRGTRPSQFCIEMHERAIARFQEYGQLQGAQLLQGQLASIRAGQVAR